MGAAGNAATLYTALTTVEVAGKLLPSAAAGVVAATVGYAALYGIALTVTIALMPLMRLALRGC